MQNSHVKKIAIVGGAGFVGHHLGIKLKSKGHSVLIVDNLAINNILSFANEKKINRKLYWTILNKRLDLLNENNLEVNIEDARNYNAMSMLLEKYRPEVIIHLAAVSHANKSNKDPHSTFDHSLRTLENTLDIAKNFNSHVIYFSSETVTEETICSPIGIYGTLKYSGELIVKSYNQVFDIPYTIIRPSALYGERCVSRRVGQIFIENALQNKQVNILGDGSDKLDFTYVEDLIEGVSLVLKTKNSINEIFNMTYGKAHSINNMVEILKKHFDNVEISYNPRDALIPIRGTLCVKKAKNLLGYNPEFPLEIGYPKYIRWYKNFYKNQV